MKFSPLLIALPISLLHASVVQANDEMMFLDEDVPVVLTATRLEQAQADVPASVTVLHGQMLMDLGIRELAEALRLVPGMMVAHENQRNTPIVQYHGGPHSSPRNLQVLINGRSMYKSAIASVVWSQLPVAMEDIERIEVVRGPNAASYGANAYQAVVNIITYHPSDTYGSRIRYTQGDNGVKDTYFKQGGGIGSADYRISLFSQSWDGFAGEDPVDGLDERQNQFMDVVLEQQLDVSSSINFELTYGETFKEIPSKIDRNFSVEDHREIDNKSYEFLMKWDKDFDESHKLHVQSYYTYSDDQEDGSVCDAANILVDSEMFELYALNPAVANGVLGLGDMPSSLTAQETALVTSIGGRYSSGTSDICGDVNEDMLEKRFDIEVQDTLVINDDFTLVSGASFRRDIAESETRFGGEVENDIYRLFSALNWQADSSWLLHAGVMLEKESELDWEVAPRVAVNYQIDPWQTLRAVYSEAVRSPDLFESQANWTYTVRNITSPGAVNGSQFFQSAQGNPDLKSERIASSELGYFGRFMQGSAELDVRVFYEELTDVMTQNLQLGNFRSENSNGMTFKGVEWQLTARPFDGTLLHWVAAYVDADADEKEDVVLRMWAEKSTSLAWTQQWPRGFSSSMAYYLADSYNAKDQPQHVAKFERLDAKISKSFSQGAESEFILSAAVQHDIVDTGIVFSGHIYDEDTRVTVSADLKF